jgi:thiamine-phosphate pyrophosphorylase
MSREYKIERVIDANLNRLKEGIRVCEDIARYLHNNKELSKKYKKLRHKAKTSKYKSLLKSRDITNDPLKKSIKDEKSIKNLDEIIISNHKRAQESARVLEEIFKLSNLMLSQRYKEIRYSLYELESSFFVNI